MDSLSSISLFSVFVTLRDNEHAVTKTVHQNKPPCTHLLLCHGKIVPRLIKDNPHAKTRKEAVMCIWLLF